MHVNKPWPGGYFPEQRLSYIRNLCLQTGNQTTQIPISQAIQFTAMLDYHNFPMKTQVFSVLLFLVPVLGFAQATTGTDANFSTGYQSSTGASRVPRAETDIPPTAEALQATLVELTNQYYAVHQLHWNVTGPLFISLHELYEGFYGDLAGYMDDVAERMLSLDQPADNRPSTVVTGSQLTPATPGGFVTDKQSLEILAARYEQLSNNVAQRIVATGETDMVTQDLLIAVKATLDLHLWKVRSVMK